MTSPKLGAPELVQGQAAPETTVNEIARFLEQGASWFQFIDETATPPGSPNDGDCYLVGSSATGAWSGQDGDIAFYMNTGWEFITPSEGMGGYFADTDSAAVFDGSTWNAIGGSSGSSATPVTEQTGTSYTFDIDDADSVVQFANASAITATIPPNSSVAFEVGTFIELHQTLAGALTLAAGSGVTLQSRGGLTELAGQYAIAGIRKVATDTWRLTGDIA